MIYLGCFHLMDEDRNVRGINDLCNKQTPDEHYPVGIFPRKQLSRLDFEPITILYGGNGSGKTTLLNIMTEKLGVFRRKEYLRTEMFSYYLQCCTCRPKSIPPGSKFLASDDIFQHILSVREDNSQVKGNKRKELEFLETARYRPERIYSQGKVDLDMDNEEEVETFFRYAAAKRKSKRQYVRSRAGEMQRQFSNGENAIMFFDQEITENAVFFLDEPENSMSPKFQVELRQLIEESVRFKNCQFVIATHSPFLLSLKNAKIYNLDASPVTVEKWYDLENVRFYYEFFKRNEKVFELSST